MDNINVAEQGESSTDKSFSIPARNSTAANVDAEGNYSEVTEPRGRLSTAFGSISVGLKRLATMIDSTFLPTKAPIAEPELIAEKTPSGWPSIAKKSALGHNTSMFPRFEVFSERVTIDQQTKLWALGQAMLEEDKKDEQEDNGRLNTLAFDVENLIQHHSAGGSKCHSCGNSTMEGPDYNQQPNMNRKDCIMEEIFTRTIRYYLFLWLQNQMDTLIKVSQHSWRDRCGYLKSELPVDSDASRALFHESDDFITTRSRQFHIPFERLIHCPRLPFVEKWFRWIFSGKDKDPHNDILNTDALNALYRVTTGLIYGVLQIAPIAILLLVDLSKAASLGVVIIFSVLFVMVMNLLGAQSDGMLAGWFSAYLAVLVVFLGNLQ